MSEVVMIVLLLALLAYTSRSIVRMGLRRLALLALMIALASVGRMILAGVPSVQPASFIIIIAGLTMGPGPGLVCGLLTTILSSFLTSVGPFMIWQMFAWGLMGFAAGYLAHAQWYILVCYGFGWGFLFGWFTNLWYYTLAQVPLNWGTFILASSKSFAMDLMHALTNAALLLMFARGSLKILRKILDSGIANSENLR